MENVKELNAKIMAITMLIQKKHPELSKYLSEVPIRETNSDDVEVTKKNLSDYYDSLKNILIKYTVDHN